MPFNKFSFLVQWYTTLCFNFVLILMVEQNHEWITTMNWYPLLRGTPQYCQYLTVDCSEMQCINSVNLSEVGQSLKQISSLRTYFLLEDTLYIPGYLRHETPLLAVREGINSSDTSSWELFTLILSTNFLH
jgi:hypothetical protein